MDAWIALHLGANLLIVGACFGGGRALARSKRGAFWGMAAAFALGGAGFFFSTRPDLLARALPFSGLVFYANFYPWAGALMVSSAQGFAEKKPQKIRLGVLCAILFLLCLRGSDFPTGGASLPSAARFDADGVCRQSSPDTCSAAAIATLLRLHGIDAAEAEAARLALTRRGRGTSRLGLFRALKLLAPEGWRVRFRKLPPEGLAELGQPAIIGAGVSKNLKTSAERAFAERYSWEPGVYHSVVFEGPSARRPGFVRIADPSFGLEEWPREHLDFLYRGFALWVEPPRRTED